MASRHIVVEVAQGSKKCYVVLINYEDPSVVDQRMLDTITKVMEEDAKRFSPIAEGWKTFDSVKVLGHAHGILGDIDKNKNCS